MKMAITEKTNWFKLPAILLSTIVIGFLDYMTGKEISFSIFYIIPISLFALQSQANSAKTIALSVFASVIWFLVEFYTREYSHFLFIVWNAFVRLAIFVVIGLLLVNLKENAKKLKQANIDLEKLNEEKNHFIGIAAHDLRNPLGAIYSLSELLIEENTSKLPPKVIEMLTMIRNMSNNTLMIIKDILDVSKIESGKVELNLIRQDYISFINQQIKISRILAEHKSISIHFDSHEQRVDAEFDSHLLSEVIDNLLSNAIKYSYENSQIVVRVSVTGQKKLMTEVIDHGKGIPEQEQQKLFNYFQKTSTLPTGGEKSTGLGLAIVKRIVLLHNGDVGVKSTLSKGSLFYFTIPLPD